MSRFLKKWRLWLAAVIAVAVVTIGFMVLGSNSQSPIPKSISDKLSFKTAVPIGNYQIKAGSIAYISQSGVLSFIAIQTGSAVTYTIAEQAIPETFHDSDQVYPALLNKMHQYAQIQTASGTVTLTHPQELSGGQTAVLNTGDTLMFVRPSQALTQDQWKAFFTSLEWQ